MLGIARHTEKAAIVVYETLHCLWGRAYSEDLRRSAFMGGRTIMIPHMNMSSESHIDGRRRFKNTFDGTCVTNVQHDAGRGRIH